MIFSIKKTLIKRNINRKKFSSLKENLSCPLIIVHNYRRRSVIKIIIFRIKQKKGRKAKKFRMILLLKSK
jgi:hypothetical protein